jgi:hypothetical protein
VGDEIKAPPPTNPTAALFIGAFAIVEATVLVTAVLTAPEKGAVTSKALLAPPTTN